MADLKSFIASSRLFAVIFGGAGCEHEISCKSAGSIIITARACGYALLPVGISRSGDFYIYLGEDEKIADGSCFDDERNLVPSFPVRIGGERGFYTSEGIVTVCSALIALHGDYGEDGRVQGLLDCVGRPFTGCDTVTGAVSVDKACTKAVAEALGIPTLPWLLLTERDAEAARHLTEERLDYPVFIKPSGLGSSVGASLVKERCEFSEAYGRAFELGHGRVLAELALTDKRELECAYINASGIYAISAPSMIRVGGSSYDFDAKYRNRTAELTVRAELTRECIDTVRNYTERICRALSVRHISRVDYFLSDDGRIYFNEINTFPGMTDGSLYPAMLESLGISAGTMISALLEAPLSEVSEW